MLTSRLLYTTHMSLQCSCRPNHLLANLPDATHAQMVPSRLHASGGLGRDSFQILNGLGMCLVQLKPYQDISRKVKC